MAIAPLQIPSYQQPRDLDFSPLAQLPRVWREAQMDATTLANLDRQRQLTNAIREYELARRQGFAGSFLDYRRALRGGQAVE